MPALSLGDPSLFPKTTPSKTARDWFLRRLGTEPVRALQLAACPRLPAEVKARILALLPGPEPPLS